MSPRRTLPWLIVAASTALLAPRLAQAAACGVFTADEGDNEIYYGLVARRLTLPCPLSPEQLVSVFPEPTFRAAICWKDVNGDWQYEEMNGCNTSTPAADPLEIFGAGGDDVIMPIVHRGLNDEFICPIEGTSGSLLDWPMARPPRPHSPPLYEWYERDRDHSRRSARSCTDPHGCPYLPMGVALFGGEGSDQLFGAPTADLLTSSDVIAPLACVSRGGTSSGDSGIDACVCAIDSTCCTDQWDWDCANLAADSCGADCSTFSFYGADESIDVMCGQAEEDVLFGDEDFGPVAFEMMSGGPDTDQCRGLWPSGMFASDCCSAASTPGCNANASIEAAVCAADPFCCASAWDALCVQQVESVAGGSCEEPGVPPCCESGSSPGCEDASIEASVCAADPYCCSTAWDSLCVGQVESVAGASCDPQTDIGLHNTCELLLQAHPASAGVQEDEIFARCGDDNSESLPPIPVGAHYPVDSGDYIISDTPGSIDFCELPFPFPGG